MFSLSKSLHFGKSVGSAVKSMKGLVGGLTTCAKLHLGPELSPEPPAGLTSSHPVLAPEDSCVAPPHLAAVPRAELRAQPEPPQRPEPEPAGCGCAGARADCAWDASAAAGGGGGGGAPPQEPSLRAHGCPRNWVVCLGCPEDPKCSWRDRLVSPAVSFGMVLELEVGWELGSLRNGHLWELEGDWHVAENDAGTVVLEGVERLEPCEVLLDEFLWNNSWALYLGTPDSSHIHVPLVACMGALDCHMAVAPRSCLDQATVADHSLQSPLMHKRPGPLDSGCDILI